MFLIFVGIKKDKFVHLPRNIILSMFGKWMIKLRNNYDIYRRVDKRKREERNNKNIDDIIYIYFLYLSRHYECIIKADIKNITRLYYWSYYISIYVKQ